MWAAHGGESGRTYLNPMLVEYLIALEMSTTGVWAVRIGMISGKEYYGYFYSEEARDMFVSEWTKDVVEVDIEPIMQPVNEA